LPVARVSSTREREVVREQWSPTLDRGIVMPHDLHDLTAQLRALLFTVDGDHDDVQTLSAQLGEVLVAARSLLGVDGAGLMLFDEDDVLRVIGVSDEASAILENAQQQVDAGPGIDCVRDGRTVAVGDLAERSTYPRLWEALTDGTGAGQTPFRAVLSVPVVAGDEVAGTFNVMSITPWHWTLAQTDAVEAYAAVIAVLLKFGATAQQRSIVHPRMRGEDYGHAEH
jgi:GAF domain-containing protein